MKNLFETVLAEFKAKEMPEAILAVGDDQNLIRIVLAWPNIPIRLKEELPQYEADWSDVNKWNWLWQIITYQKSDMARAIGISYNLEKLVDMLIANRIVYPDGEVHSYVTRYLRDRVVRLFDTRQRSRSGTAPK